MFSVSLDIHCPMFLPSLTHVFLNCSENVGLAKAKNFLTRQGLVPNNQDCMLVQHICQIEFFRSANLCAAGLAAIITHMHTSQKPPRLNFGVAVSGAMYRGQTQ